MGKGAWDCDLCRLIPPEKEAEVFEELTTMDFPFEGIATVPPRKNMTCMAFFCSGCRYRVTASPSDLVREVKERLIKGGIGRSNKGFTPGIHQIDDLVLIYAGQTLNDHDKALDQYHVPPVSVKQEYQWIIGLNCSCSQGCQCLIAIDAAKLKRGSPDPDSAYWN